MKPSSPAKITKSEINQARKPSSWDVANDWLYALCKKHPSHKTNSEIIAKVMLIGRATSAAIERRKIDRDVPDFYLSRVAPKIKRSCIDLWFREIKSASQGLDDGSLKVLVDVHFKLVNLFHDITDLSKRCLASKYLHYHFPSTTFIYDSQASRAAKVLVPATLMLLSSPPKITIWNTNYLLRDAVG
jgi:hypothetical protein